MQHDAIVVGGGFAGLAAATYLARARRSVCVIDTRQPRNRFADASHGFLSRDGRDPGMILGTAREQLRSYPTVRMKEGEAAEVRTQENGFSIVLAAGEEITARKAVLAFGLHDTLPPIPGLQER